MMVLVGPDVPEELAGEIGRHHKVYYSHTTYPGHGPRELLAQAGQHGFGAVVTNDPAIKQAARQEQGWGGSPPRVIPHAGQDPLPAIRQSLSDQAKALGLHEETVFNRLSRERRQEKGLGRTGP